MFAPLADRLIIRQTLTEAGECKLKLPKYDVSEHRYEFKNLDSLLTPVVDAFDKSPLVAFPPPSFRGTGIYGLYYFGDYGLYQPLVSAAKNGRLIPIYVGKAVPAGARQAKNISSEAESSALYSRLRDHYRSVSKIDNLKAGDFKCKFLVLVGSSEDMTPAAEAAVIRKYNPLWNSVIDGFGNHTPGKRRFDQQLSGWDTLHVGRTWAKELRGGYRLTPSQLVEKVNQHLVQLNLL